MAAPKPNAEWIPFQLGVLRKGDRGQVPGKPMPIVIEKRIIVALAEA